MVVRRKSIMVIEDSSTVQQIVSGYLGKYGYFVILAPTVENALRHSPGEDVHVAIVDLILPGIGGLAGISFLREKWPNIGIVAMSGGNEMVQADTMLAAARKVGAHRILKKPFGETDLIGIVNGLIEQGFGDEVRKDRILVVEDSRTVRLFIARTLGEAGYEVLEAGTMEEALDSPEILSVDLIMTDIFMPGKGGIEGIRTIKENWPHVPILAMSGGVAGGVHRDDALAAARKIGANATIPKPFGAPDLLDVVRRLLDPS